MVYREAFFDTGSFLRVESLKVDGSNFPDWFECLYNTLKVNGLAHMLSEPLEEEPDDSTSEDEFDEYRYRRDMTIFLEVIMRNSMEPELRIHFLDSRPMDMVDELRELFLPQVRWWKHELLDQFLSTIMEENTCLERHLRIMHEIHEKLVHLVDYWMTDAFAIDGVLRSLPPSYKEHVRECVMRGDSDQYSFHEFISQLRTVKGGQIAAGEVIDGAGICDIQFMNVILLQALVAVKSMVDTYSVL